jgi:glycosyltransferase involved in cell wall biosynthesis
VTAEPAAVTTEPAVRRFALVAPNFHPRVCGVGDHSARLGDELRSRGHEVVVYSRLPVAPHPEAPAVEVRGLPGRVPTLIAHHVARAIAARPPTDVILQYTAQMWDAWRFGSPALIWLAMQARRAGARVTLIAHELYVPWLPRPDLALAALSQRLQLAALVRACDHVFVTTETRAAQIASACALLGAPAPGVIRVGANAIPVPRGPRDVVAGGRSGPQLGVFSTAAVGKRFDVVLDAFARVAREVPAAELVLIGDLGPPDRPRVREILESVRRHPAAARIRMTGRLPLSDVAAEIGALDAYLFPMSTGANTRSGTLPVALGAGLPVVAVSGPETDADLFRDGENIVLAANLDGLAFADATLRLLRDPALAARVGAGARRLYDEHLAWPRIADHLLAAI